MKCDHIRTRTQGDTPFFPNMLNNWNVEVCLKEDVDAAIAELKAENKILKKHIANGDVSRITWIDEVIELKQKLDKAIAERDCNQVCIDALKAKLENVQASMYADVVDANMENRKLRRDLWLARAYRGRDNSILLPSKFMRNVWDAVERKCRAKADEYK